MQKLPQILTQKGAPRGFFSVFAANALHLASPSCPRRCPEVPEAVRLAAKPPADVPDDRLRAPAAAVERIAQPAECVAPLQWVPKSVDM